MGELAIQKLHRQLSSHNQLMNSGLVIQNVNQNSIRIDKLDAFKPEIFLKYTPIMFFLVSSEHQLIKLELMTYNEEVFEMVDFAVDSSEDVFDFVINKFKNLNFSVCSGVRLENIKAAKLKKYIKDDNTIHESYGNKNIFRSKHCKRLISNENDLCETCKSWLISKEANSEDIALEDCTEIDFCSNLDELSEVKVKFESSLFTDGGEGKVSKVLFINIDITI